jgi:hypothetical protein
VALALAGVGLCGLTAYMVVRHRRVRRADGAGGVPRQVLSLVLRESRADGGDPLGLAIAYGAGCV